MVKEGYLCNKKNAMKRLDVAIKIDSIYAEVRKIAEYKGVKRNEASGGLSYELMRITKAEQEMLDTYLQEVTGMLEEQLKQYLVPTEEEEGMMKMTCMLPDSWDEQLEKSCTRDIEMIMTNYIASRWISMVKPDAEATEMDVATGKMKDLRTKIYYRARPKKKEADTCCCTDW